MGDFLELVGLAELEVDLGRLAGDFFYVAPMSGTHPIWLSLWQIVLPALAVCLPVNMTLTLLFSLYYSQKLAGPLHRLKQDMLKAARGEKNSPASAPIRAMSLMIEEERYV